MKRIVIFLLIALAADWCPTCRVALNDINANGAGREARDLERRRGGRHREKREAGMMGP